MYKAITLNFDYGLHFESKMAGGTFNINKGLYLFIPFRCRTTRRVEQNSGERNSITSRNKNNFTFYLVTIGQPVVPRGRGSRNIQTDVDII